MRWHRRSKLAMALVVVAAPFALYVSALTAEAVSARNAARKLDRVEALRLGDPMSDFTQIIGACKLDDPDRATDVGCTITSGAHWFEFPWSLLARLPVERTWPMYRLLEKAGLRSWSLTVCAREEGGRLRSISARFFVVGRYETLGTSWEISEQVPTRRGRTDRLTSDEQRTYFHWYHITSGISGEGLRIQTTPRSTVEELRARRINRRCLMSFRGCDGLCELLPDAMPLITKRGIGLGCTSVPESWCEPDRCRAEMRSHGIFP